MLTKWSKNDKINSEYNALAEYHFELLWNHSL